VKKLILETWSNFGLEKIAPGCVISDRWGFGIHFGSDEISAKSIFSHLPGNLTPVRAAMQDDRGGTAIDVHPNGAWSRRQMRCCEADELPGGDDFGLLPELRKMLLIAGNEVVSTGFVSAFQKYIVVRVARHFQTV
jgi:hypothetical protein